MQDIHSRRDTLRLSVISFTDWCWYFALILLALCVAAWFAYPVLHFNSVASFNYSEGWVSYWDEAARLGRPLYAAPPDLNITNYPPVSFHLVALLSPVFSNVTIAGRTIGMLCLLWSASNIASATSAIAGSKRAGVFAALCFLLWVAYSTQNRLATNDPHFIGLALSTLGVCAFIRADGQAKWIAAAALFFATSLFVKNNLIAFPLASVIYLIVFRQIKLLLIYFGSGIITAAIFLSLTFAIDGPFLLSHLLARRAFSWMTGAENLGGFYLAFSSPMLISLGWLLWSRSKSASYLGLCIACAAVLAAFFGFGNGVAGNIQYELIAALAMTVGVAVGALRSQINVLPRASALAMVVAALAVAPMVVKTPGEVYGVIGRSERLPRRVADYQAALTLVAQTSGPALCESLLMCLEAGKPFTYDPYFVKDQISVGRIPESRIIGEIEAKHYAVIQIGEDSGAFPLGPGERLRFNEGVVKALLANYQVSQQTSNYAVFLPK